MRNFVCAHVNRNDPASRRFLQYLTMRTDSVLCLIRDAKTGKVLHKPPLSAPGDDCDNLWLARERSGLGRASKNEWNILERVEAAIFDRMASAREWRFGFNDFYDVYVWDLVPGQKIHDLFGNITTVCYSLQCFWRQC